MALTSSVILKKKILYLLANFGLWVLIFALQKPVFLLLYAGGLAQTLPVVWHGLPLDISMAGYLTLVPALLLLISSIPLRTLLHVEWWERALQTVFHWWTIIAAIIVAIAFVVNCVLYSYWHFPLDSTSIFFITTSPKDAMASVEWWQGVGVMIGVSIVAITIYKLFNRLARQFHEVVYMPMQPWGSLVMLLVMGALFLPIRGGVTVSTMNTGRAYFSDNPIYNHAAVNPLFSFMENMIREEDFASQYRFMTDKEACQLVAPMMSSSLFETDSAHIYLLSDNRPDIYLVILESFSDTLMKMPGVTPYLNEMKREGIYFSRFYANSFRTDRGLLSILHGYPSPATISLMKFPRKTSNLPSLPKQLKKAGWDLGYYYGGDADFTNMRSFLVDQGFQKITEDVDFPVGERMSKWGVPDHLLFKRIEEDLQHEQIDKPLFRVIQTSSSHEPFDVPYHRLDNKTLNAFAYTDSCLGRFVKYLKDSDRWKKSLVIFVPDHLGAWPQDADYFSPWCFHIPMIWSGGIVNGSKNINTFASQQDIAATILGQLRLQNEGMQFSKDILDTRISHFAFFMMNDGFGLIDEENEVIYDNKMQRTLTDKGLRKGKNVARGQAYLQTIFNDIAAR